MGVPSRLWAGGWPKTRFSELKGVLFILLFAGRWWWRSPTCARGQRQGPAPWQRCAGAQEGGEGADLPAWLGAASCPFVLSAILLLGCGRQVLLLIAPVLRKVAGSLPWALTTCNCSLGCNYLGFLALSASSVHYRYSPDQAPGPQLLSLCCLHLQVSSSAHCTLNDKDQT